jgi:hypothetical protein
VGVPCETNSARGRGGEASIFINIVGVTREKCVISGFRRGVNETRAVLGFYAT